MRASKGRVAHRLHDGIDIYAADGQPLFAPFSGMSSTRAGAGSRGSRDRYGGTVVIVSDEPIERGIPCHVCPRRGRLGASQATT